MTPHRIWQNPKTGYTLAEMLIVITIMVMLVAITLPTVKRVMEDSGTREASRQLNAYFAMAKARAVQTGRPCGVLMICDQPLGNVDTTPPTTAPIWPASSAFHWPVRQVTKMFLAEVPPPYSGGTIGARGRIRESPTLVTSPIKTYCFYPLFFNAVSGQIERDDSELAILNSLIGPGEEFAIRFEFKGPWFICVRDVVSGEFIYSSPSRNGLTQAGTSFPLPPEITNPANTFPGSTYQIIRMPRRIGNPLEMPLGSCIDLAYSGIGPSGVGFYPSGATTALADVQSLAVMFSPDGNIDRVYVSSKTDMASEVPATTVHFLVGKVEKMAKPLATNTNTATDQNMFDPQASNLADPLSLWLSIARTSGIVVTSDNQPPIVEGSSVSRTNLVLFPGSPQRQQLDPTNAAGFAQRTYISHCRLLATNREEVRGQ